MSNVNPNIQLILDLGAILSSPTVTPEQKTKARARLEKLSRLGPEERSAAARFLNSGRMELRPKFDLFAWSLKFDPIEKRVRQWNESVKKLRETLAQERHSPEDVGWLEWEFVCHLSHRAQLEARWKTVDPTISLDHLDEKDLTRLEDILRRAERFRSDGTLKIVNFPGGHLDKLLLWRDEKNMPYFPMNFQAEINVHYLRHAIVKIYEALPPEKVEEFRARLLAIDHPKELLRLREDYSYLLPWLRRSYAPQAVEPPEWQRRFGDIQ